MQLDQLFQVFDRTVGIAHQTRLEGGAAEPLYQPRSGSGESSVVYFRNDYVSSALHEIAHWCIAGHERRRQEDYGYWYQGDRGVQEQRAFEQVEARPQALEWIMSQAADISFRVSCDNFDESTLDMPEFRRSVQCEVFQLLHRMPTRADIFVGGLIQVTGCYGALKCDAYQELPP